MLGVDWFTNLRLFLSNENNCVNAFRLGNRKVDGIIGLTKTTDRTNSQFMQSPPPTYTKARALLGE